MSTYTERIDQQIAQYADTANMHDLPAIFHVWSQNYIRPGMEEVFGTSSMIEAYALAFLEARERTTGEARILSIGCGDGSVEINVAQSLLNRNQRDFRIVCADLSPILLEKLTKTASEKGLSSLIEVVVADLNMISIDGTFNLIMAHHSLHHIQALENLFQYCHAHLRDGGIFATNDMIGRNGHMRWPETRAVLSVLWPTLSVERRYHAQLKRVDEIFTDHDCSTEGFEGIRAQDILPLLLKTFHPYKFHGFGGFIDVMVDRGYGHGYDVNDRSAVALIRSLADLNEIMLDAGVIKPTAMMAYFTKENRGESFYRARSALSCVRWPNIDPLWTRYYQTEDNPRLE